MSIPAESPDFLEHISGPTIGTVKVSEIDLILCQPQVTVVRCRDGRRLVLLELFGINWLRHELREFVQINGQQLVRPAACIDLHNDQRQGARVALRGGCFYPVKRRYLGALAVALLQEKALADPA